MDIEDHSTGYFCMKMFTDVCSRVSWDWMCRLRSQETPAIPQLRQGTRYSTWYVETLKPGLLVSRKIGGVPSGELTFCHGKSPFFMGKSTISMAIFHCYVSSPEGTTNRIHQDMQAPDISRSLSRWVNREDPETAPSMLIQAGCHGVNTLQTMKGGRREWIFIAI